jgi:dTMP kinase
LPAAQSRARGRLICVCGIDGSGKTRHARNLARRLRAGGVPARAVTTLARGGDFLPLLREVHDRASRQTVADLIAFERYRRVRRTVVPALGRSQTVVCDRYFYTDIVYAQANGCDPALARELLTLAPRPDVTLILQTPPRVALERVAGRAQPRKWAPAHTALFLAAAARGFGELAREVGAVCIDSDRSFAVVADEMYRAATRAADPGLAPLQATS